MGLFGNQFSNVVEWQESRDDIMFWKWNNDEIKKGSKLVIRPGQDAIFMYNGKVEGIFKDPGSFDIESQIIPFLSTLKGIKFGFNSGVRAEVLFINTKEFTIRWGTKSPINIQAPGLPGGMPIGAFGTFSCKIDDYFVFIEKIAGVKKQYMVDEIKERVTSALNPMLMKWITREGKDMFNLQANAMDIAKGIQADLDMDTLKIGITITAFNIESFNYPESVKRMQERVASQSMVGDMGRYTQMAMVDSMANGTNGAGSAANNMAGMANTMAGMQMGMMMGQQMVNSMQGSMNNMQQAAAGVTFQTQGQMQNQNITTPQSADGAVQAPKFCPNCGTKTEGAKFCSNCGTKLI
ncbi:MAG: SPFH domain-containing protein [Lachnospiraceae bacterium]|nr:SPFH domain-containing protein [Lachnospiraceae bacterium]